MNTAVAGTAACIVVALAAAVALFVIEQPAAGWTTLVIGLLGLVILLGMVASTGRADSQSRAQ